MKKKFFAVLLVVCFAAVGCSGESGSASDTSISENFTSQKDSYNSNSNGLSFDGYDQAEEFESDSVGAADSTPKDVDDISDFDVSKDVSDDNNTSKETKKVIEREMLVYTCTADIDTLDYEQSVRSFKDSLQKLGGFIESEHYSDGANHYGYWVEEVDKKKYYTATVRIPSAKYDQLVNSFSDLGDVRSKDATVENVSQEYRDIGIQLEILEAKEKIFMKMLKEAVTIDEMMSIESSLTEIQVQIEQLKSRMMTIETDVAYSYVHLTITEVTKYQEKPKQTDTFAKRLQNTVTETASGFVEFLEALLFLVIRLFPYVLVFGFIGIMVFKCRKSYRKKHPKKEKSRDFYPAPDYRAASYQKAAQPQAEQSKQPEQEEHSDNMD